MPYKDLKSDAAKAAHARGMRKWMKGKGREYEKLRAARKKQQRRDFIDAYRHGAACAYCGALDVTLHFHHRDPATKLFPVARCLTRSWEKIHAEIAKCDLICVPCHKAKHAHR